MRLWAAQRPRQQLLCGGSGHVIPGWDGSCCNHRSGYFCVPRAGLLHDSWIICLF